MSRYVLIFVALLLLATVASSTEGLIGPVALVTGFVAMVHFRTRPTGGS